jgi:hypothetical protein
MDLSESQFQFHEASVKIFKLGRFSLKNDQKSIIMIILPSRSGNRQQFQTSRPAHTPLTMCQLWYGDDAEINREAEPEKVRHPF